MIRPTVARPSSSHPSSWPGRRVHATASKYSVRMKRSTSARLSADPSRSSIASRTLRTSYVMLQAQIAISIAMVQTTSTTSGRRRKNWMNSLRTSASSGPMDQPRPRRKRRQASVSTTPA
jgi:hypothetical protein